jgi:hypothetical protein
MTKLKNIPKNLTEKEWTFLLMVFDDYVENLDSSESTIKMLRNIQKKLFCMELLIKQEEKDYA